MTPGHVTPSSVSQCFFTCKVIPDITMSLPLITGCVITCNLILVGATTLVWDDTK